MSYLRRPKRKKLRAPQIRWTTTGNIVIAHGIGVLSMVKHTVSLMVNLDFDAQVDADAVRVGVAMFLKHGAETGDLFTPLAEGVANNNLLDSLDSIDVLGMGPMQS